MIECVQQIPCNPCTEVCSQGAITIEGDITNVPHVDFEKCNGCGICIANCPGLAIFSVDESLGEEVAEVGLPYEFRPLPEKGEVVELIDRAGNAIGTGKVKRILTPKSFDKTAVVYLEVPKKLSLEVRFFKRKN
jgi:Fe-S-cluster-containing hydrogenase component 2